jgi:hypothetical protein
VAAVRHQAHHYLHEGHNYAHLAYFGGVFIEGHGFYSGVAGVLFVITGVMTFAGDGEV